MTRTQSCEVPVSTSQHNRLQSNSVVRQTNMESLELESSFHALVEEYVAESKPEEMPRHNPDMAGYKRLEAAGMLSVLGAYDDNKLIGFIIIIATPVPHYGSDAKLATVESYFVSCAHRRGGTGLKLLRAAETKAKEMGAVVMFVSAPVNGRLIRVMPSFGYRESNRVFCRRLS